MRRRVAAVDNFSTRKLLATADCRQGYASVATQVAQTYAPVGTAEFGDGRGAVMVLEVKYRLDDKVIEDEMVMC